MYYICCKILGIKPGSDVNAIKSAYRKAAKELHPDINHFENADKYFMILQNAYKYLLNNPISQVKIIQSKQRVQFSNIKKVRVKPIVYYSLREILKGSYIARAVYVFFHVLFLSLGIYMVFCSTYDVFVFPVDSRVPAGTAYLTIVLGFLFGLAFALIFLVSGINYIRNR